MPDTQPLLPMTQSRLRPRSASRKATISGCGPSRRAKLPESSFAGSAGTGSDSQIFDREYDLCGTGHASVHPGLSEDRSAPTVSG